MTDSSPDRPAGHAELADRIMRFLDHLDREGRDPSREATYHVVTALSRIESAEIEEGHRAMDKAEREVPLPPEASDMVESRQDFTTWQLRSAFQGALNPAKK